jgi:hypothetical protein
VPPIRYLEAGSRLFNSGNFELAAKYLDAAQIYRDQLQQDEQTMLDAYLKELSKVRASTAAGSTATDGAGPATTGAAPATTAAAVQAAPATTRVIQSGDPARGGAGDVAITPDVKQHAVWLLHEAREQMAQGNLDAAEKKIAEAEAIDIKWGLFDDTPTKVRTDLDKERPKHLASTSKPACRPGESPDRSGGGHRAGGQELEPELQPLRREPGQGRRRGPSSPQAR